VSPTLPTSARMAAVALAALAVAGCDADLPTPAESAGAPVPEACRVVALHSDYGSTSISLLTEAGDLCAADALTSGSRAPGLVTALSGDVVLPSTPDPAGRVVLIDRFPHAVLTFATAGEGGVVVRDQLPVGTGFAANPQDVAFVTPSLAVVSRYETNLRPSADPGALDGGGDLLFIDPGAPAILDRLDLGPEAADGVQPRPGRLAIAGDRVWVALGNLSRGFDRSAEGRVLGVEPLTRAITDRVALSGLENCGGALAASPEGDGIWVGCAGLWAAGAAGQIAASGLAWIDLGAGSAALTWSGRAPDLFAGRPLGWALAPLPGGRVVVSAFGDLDGAPDRLFLVDRATGEAAPLDIEAPAFQLASLLWSPAAEVLLVADASPSAPMMRRFGWSEAGTPIPWPPVMTSPAVGLEPRHLAFFR